jgi:hypothetical protein
MEVDMSVLRRLAYPTALALLLTGTFTFSAMGWSSFGDGCGTTFLLCVSDDDNNTAPRATTNDSDSSYSGDFYFNTSLTIDNSIQSMQNWFSSRDVTFHQDYNQTGNAFCVDSLFEYSAISIFWDNTFSSHQVGNDDNAC